MNLLILYGSQTGTGQDYAETVYLEATMKGITANVMSLNDYVKKMDENSASMVVIIISNTGDGDAPDNAVNFWKFINEKKDQVDLFSGQAIALLGLGDSGYATFNCTGKFLESTLPGMGAKWLFPPAYCDALLGNEAVWETWQKDLWTALEKEKNQAAGATEQNSPSISDLQKSMNSLSLSEDASSRKGSTFVFWQLPRKSDIPEEALNLENLPRVYPISVVLERSPLSDKTSHNSTCQPAISNDPSIFSPIIARDISLKTITSKQAVKEVTLVTFRVSDSRWKCEAGDSFGLCCENNPSAVDSLLTLLDLDGSTIIQVTSLNPVMSGGLLELINGRVLSLREIFLKHTDIMHFPKKSFLRPLADFCSDPDDRRNLLYLTSKAGSPDYMSLANGHACLLDFLCTFKSCKPSLECLFSHLPALHPRFYSVCSAGHTSNSDSAHIEFIYSSMDYKVPNGEERRGVCSAWLERCKMQQLEKSEMTFKVFPRPSPHFRLPEDPATAMIMICAGTGVSPFIGFLRTLEERSIRMEFTWLIFGFRHRAHDFLFGDELKEFQQLGILSRLTIATSREPESGNHKYVQDALKANSEEIHKLMTFNPIARIYICGDELTMIKDVNACLQEMLKEHGGLDARQAQAEFNSWNSNKRIIRDVWV